MRGVARIEEIEAGIARDEAALFAELHATRDLLARLTGLPDTAVAAASVAVVLAPVLLTGELGATDRPTVPLRTDDEFVSTVGSWRRVAELCDASVAI